MYFVGGAAETDDVGAGGKNTGVGASLMTEHAIDGIHFRHYPVGKVLERDHAVAASEIIGRRLILDAIYAGGIANINSSYH